MLVFDCTTLHCSSLHFPSLHCTVLYFTVLHYTLHGEKGLGPFVQEVRYNLSTRFSSPALHCCTILFCTEMI